MRPAASLCNAAPAGKCVRDLLLWSGRVSLETNSTYIISSMSNVPGILTIDDDDFLAGRCFVHACVRPGMFGV